MKHFNISPHPPTDRLHKLQFFLLYFSSLESVPYEGEKLFLFSPEVRSSEIFQMVGSSKRMHLIAAVERSLGIGRGNDLPWQLDQEYAYFDRMTTSTSDGNKMVIIFLVSFCLPCMCGGRKVWR